MPLAQQLAELALANSQGLLNDDEYRLLRQNLFEQHSNSAFVPTEAPILPVSPIKLSPPLPRVRIVDTPPAADSSASRKPTLRRKGSFTLSNLLKRGGNDKPAPAAEPHSAPPTIKRGFIPRLQKKASELFSSGDKRPTVPPVTHSSRPPPSLADTSLIARHPPNTHLRSPTRTAIPTFPSTHPGTSADIFDERNLSTANDFRTAIIATEAEAQRIQDAFDNLESSTSFRVTQQNARRLRAATPQHVTALIDGSNWRTYKPPTSAQSQRKTHYVAPPSAETVTSTDNSSVRSISSSIKTSLSRSKSISSLRGKNPTSPLSARFPPSASSPPPSILRKNSVSSVASSAQFGVTSRSSLSRSTGHLPLGVLVEREGATELERPGTSDTDTDTSTHPEVSEIQRRRDQVMARYVARLEYLQARLKSAELHEKLMRR